MNPYASDRIVQKHELLPIFFLYILQNNYSIEIANSTSDVMNARARSILHS